MMRSPTHLSGQIQFISTEGQRLRVFQRVRIDGEVIVHDEERLHIARLQDISAGGLFIEDLNSIPPGKQVRLVIKSSKLQKAVQATGKIVRVEKELGNGSAVEFTSISSRAREIIQNCVFEQRMERALKVA